MKPIIVDMKDMSDSTEVYSSKPNRFMVYTIYVILLAVLVAFVWMYFSKIDIVVKSNGIFKGNDEVYRISSGVTGNVKENLVENGQYVNKGDVLYVLEIGALSDTIVHYQNEKKASEDRLNILSAYEDSLGENKEALFACEGNPYLEEFENRRNLLFANVDLNKEDTQGQASLYQGNVDSISKTIGKYKEKIEKLKKVKTCITSRSNSFDSGENYYYSIVSGYLVSYSYTEMQYDNQIKECQRQIEEYQAQIDSGKEQEKIPESVSGNMPDLDIKNLEKQRDSLEAAKETTKKEKEKALVNLELQQITAIEQQIAGLNDTLISLESNLTSAKLQLESMGGVDNETKENVVILTEKGKIAAEILSYQEKLKECENYLESYDIQNDNCTIRASSSGFFHATQDLKTGTYVQEGTDVGTIYPEKESKYYAEIYVENSDIAKVKEGQKVKFEIAAYPSSEYGYFTGVVENIAKDISIDQNTGYAYYLVRIGCNNMTVKNKEGEEAALINGMACQAKIVVEEKNVLTYLLEKIDLLD